MGFEVVQEFTKDRSVAARVVSANMLANEKSPRSLESLREALRDKNWVVRLAAVKALARAGDRGAVPALEERMEDLDEKPPVRMMAAASILNLQGKAVAPKESPGE
jgi:HEAT repeat protein